MLKKGRTCQRLVASLVLTCTFLLVEGRAEDEHIYINTVYDFQLPGVRINTWNETKNADPPVLPYLWVACSERGTVVRIATSTCDPLTQQTVQIGEILGEYRTAPEGCANGNLGYKTDPSRTAVDFDGSAWIAN